MEVIRRLQNGLGFPTDLINGKPLFINHHKTSHAICVSISWWPS